MTDGLYGEVCGFDKFEISNFYLEQCLDDYFASSSYAKEIKRTNLSKIWEINKKASYNTIYVTL